MKLIYNAPVTEVLNVRIEAILAYNSKGQLIDEDGNVIDGLAKPNDFFNPDDDAPATNYNAWNDEIDGM